MYILNIKRVNICPDFATLIINKLPTIKSIAVMETIPYPIYNVLKYRLHMTFSGTAEVMHSLISYSYIDVILTKSRICLNSSTWPRPKRSTAILHGWKVCAVKKNYVSSPNLLSSCEIHCNNLTSFIEANYYFLGALARVNSDWIY